MRKAPRDPRGLSFRIRFPRIGNGPFAKGLPQRRALTFFFPLQKLSSLIEDLSLAVHDGLSLRRCQHEEKRGLSASKAVSSPFPANLATSSAVPRMGRSTGGDRRQPPDLEMRPGGRVRGKSSPDPRRVDGHCGVQRPPPLLHLRRERDNSVVQAALRPRAGRCRHVQSRRGVRGVGARGHGGSEGDVRGSGLADDPGGFDLGGGGSEPGRAVALRRRGGGGGGCGCG
jgi:hypothetical protein